MSTGWIVHKYGLHQWALKSLSTRGLRKDANGHTMLWRTRKEADKARRELEHTITGHDKLKSDIYRTQYMKGKGKHDKR